MEKEYIKKTLKPLIPKYLLAIFCGLLLNLLAIVSTLISKFLLDNVLPSKDTSLLTIFVLGYISFYVFRNIISFLKEFLFSKYGYRILYDIRSDMFSCITSKFNFSSFSSEKQGYIITLFRDWITSISWFLSNILLNTITECILLLIALTVLAVVNLKMFFITLITLPLYGLIYLCFNSKIRKNRGNMMDTDVQVTQNLKDSLDSIKEIRILNTEDIFIEKYNLAQKEFSKQGLKYVIITAVYDSLANIVSIFGHIIVLYYGGLEVFSGNMTVGTLIALNSIVALLYSPIERVVNFNRLLQAFKIELGKLTEFLKNNISETDVKENVDYLPYANQKSKNVLLKLDSVSFSYGDLKVLENINFEIEKGYSYAIVGENGSGKSTLINLVTGLLSPNCGNIFFDGINIHQDLYKFRKQIGYVPQDTFLLNDSILNNITFGRKNDLKHDIEELLSVCEVDSLMKSNLSDLNTIIGEKGNKLSGGQKQKIALCRALYNDPKLLIIDEGTSNTDSDSERRILNNIKRAFPDLSIILISHRLSTIKSADNILVLKDSRIIENGNVDKLYSKGSEFYKMFANQS
ncbi:MAG: ATP-binding cassette domain-containing protein [Clostridium argentinense]|uniref:peptidase domain-containing ABC transporter n=1 Tax=uncultured Clostridium sp. TaxID=59620 RepID=UPI001DAEC1C6|nr:ABC transporter transmembrane domain-containing protein [uncultured Clostridium sp.]MBS5823133.1 ATP-binding cassette domain-containing protein [Clostridium argentinense]MDU1350388.1 ABC transporter transmembrane domain-containing protein [Clostridium argentinense]